MCVRQGAEKQDPLTTNCAGSNFSQKGAQSNSSWREQFQLEDDMNRHLELHQASKTAVDQLHPAVHVSAGALLIWFIAAAWLLFGGRGYIDLALAIISILVFVVLAIPLALWRAKRSADVRSTAANDNNDNDAVEETQPLRMWLRGEFATHSGGEKSSIAVVEMLLPLAAVAFGMTALGIVFDLVRAGAF
jgi:hypothetical protein